LEDLPATIVSRMGLAVPKHFEGRPLHFVNTGQDIANA